MKILFLGDVMGKAGREAISLHLPALIADYDFDFVVVNGENASHGRGLTEKHFLGIIEAGADVVTLGDHAFDQRETISFIEREPNLVRPINFMDGTAGRGAAFVTGRNGHQVLVINALGRVFMNPMADPFAAIAKGVADCPLGEMADAIIVDFHAEATSETQAMGHFLDNKVSLVVGTHTHIPTSDQRILAGGTAIMGDAGMCGDYNSVIGMETDEPLNRFTTGQVTGRFIPAADEVTLCGVAIETDAKSGLCLSVHPVRVGGVLAEALPQF